MLSIQERLGLQTESVQGAGYQWAAMLRCAIPGRVVSFDSVKQTCVVQPLIQEIVLLPPPATTQNSTPGSTQNIPTAVTIKPLQDVPIIMMRVPGWSITFPITQGTDCLLIFADTCIDGWWQNGEISPPFDRRRHDLSDAFALFGPWSQKNLLSDYSTSSMQIRSDDQSVVIDLAVGQVTVTAPVVQVKSVGGTPLPVMNSGLMTWITTVLLPALASHSITVAAPPTTVVTTVLEAQ